MNKIALITIIKKVDKFEWREEDTCAFSELIAATKYLEFLGYTLKKEGRALRFKNEELETIAQIKMIELNRSLNNVEEEIK